MLNIDQNKFLLNFNNSINSNFLKNEIIVNADEINIKIFENENTFNDKDWYEIYKLSEDIFVEESDSLKEQAAGAGLTDND